MREHDGGVNCVALSPSGYPKPQTPDPTPQPPTPNPKTPNRNAGTFFAAGSDDRTVKVVRLSTGDLLTVLAGHTGAVRLGRDVSRVSNVVASS